MIGGPSFHLSAWYATLKKAALKRWEPSEKQVADVNTVNSTFIRVTEGKSTRNNQYASKSSDSKMSNCQTLKQNTLCFGQLIRTYKLEYLYKNPEIGHFSEVLHKDTPYVEVLRLPGDGGHTGRGF